MACCDQDQGPSLQGHSGRFKVKSAIFLCGPLHLLKRILKLHKYIFTLMRHRVVYKTKVCSPRWGYSSMFKIRLQIFFMGLYFFLHKRIFNSNKTNVRLIKTRCCAQDPSLYLKGEGHSDRFKFKLWDLPFITSLFKGKFLKYLEQMLTWIRRCFAFTTEVHRSKTSFTVADSKPNWWICLSGVHVLAWKIFEITFNKCLPG